MNNETKNKLYKICYDFIQDNKITKFRLNNESDLIINDSFSFIENICNIIGYVDEPVDKL